jgi:hypothetical protein
MCTRSSVLGCCQQRCSYRQQQLLSRAVLVVTVCGLARAVMDYTYRQLCSVVAVVSG